MIYRKEAFKMIGKILDEWGVTVILVILIVVLMIKIIWGMK